ncbi:MAG: response regulator, partial [Opitutaceae bacterium]
MHATTSHTILLVEDEENDVTFMTMALQKAGIAGGLRVAEDGQQALDYLAGEGGFADRVRHPLPALVL